jgi:hypothetical protein
MARHDRLLPSFVAFVADSSSAREAPLGNPSAGNAAIGRGESSSRGPRCKAVAKLKYSVAELPSSLFYFEKATMLVL